MPSSIVRRLIPAILLATLVAACDETATTPTPTTTTTPTPTSGTVTQNDSFDGTLSQNGSNTHTFSTQAGAVTVIIVSEEPDATVALGLDLGQWDAKTKVCSTVVTSTSAMLGSVLIGTATTAIDVCIKVYDVGNIAEETSVAYTVTAQHQVIGS